MRPVGFGTSGQCPHSSGSDEQMFGVEEQILGRDQSD